MNDDFYIGWQAKAPPSYAGTVRRLVAGILALALLGALGLASAQRLIGVAFFEWGHVGEFSGLLCADPYPYLIMPRRPGDLTNGWMAAPLVAPFKYGVRREDIAAFDGQAVSLRATRIHRDGQLMLELKPGSVTLLATADPQTLPSRATVPLGEHTFRGEIVDSKCWMGVMNPGVLTPHRACAVRCISGGVPPMLLVRRETGPSLNLLLVSPEDRPVNDQVLELVAEPVEITGTVERRAGLLFLRADPATYRRIARQPGSPNLPPSRLK